MQISTDPMNRMKPRDKSGFCLECGTTVQNVSLGMQMVFSEIVKSEDLNFRADGTKKPSTIKIIGVPWRMTDGRCTVDRPEIRVDPIPIPPLPLEGTRIQRERPSKTSTNSEPLLDANAIKRA